MRDALPRALDEAVVAPGAFVIHAELDPGLLDPSDSVRMLVPLDGYAFIPFSALSTRVKVSSMSAGVWAAEKPWCPRARRP